MSLEQLENGDSVEFNMDRGWGFSPASSPNRYVSNSSWGTWNSWADDSSKIRSGRDFSQISESVDDGWGASKVPSERDFSQISDSVDDGWGSFDDSNVELEDPSPHENMDPKCPGLMNLGNTCFLNAVLQCLTYTIPLANAIVSSHHSVSCQIQGFCAMCALADHFKVVFSASGKALSPSYLAENINEISRSFYPGEQQDAHECFLYLIEALQKCNTSNSQRDKSFVEDIFTGQMRSQLRCSSCSHSSDSVEDFLGLSLEVENSCSVNDALATFVAVEELEQENKVSCTICNQKTSRSKQFSFDRAPEVLVIQLKRFKASSFYATKIDKEVCYELTLDLTPFRSKKLEKEIQEGDWKYRLYGVIVHSGWSTTSGHYFCYVQTTPGIWHWMNDSMVSTVTEDTVLGQEAYMLFYIREEILQHKYRFVKSSPKIEASDTADDESNLGVFPVHVETSSSIQDPKVDNVTRGKKPLLMADMSSNTSGTKIEDMVMTNNPFVIEPSASLQQAPVEIEVDGPMQDASPVLSECIPTAEVMKDTLQQVPIEMDLEDPVTCSEAYESSSSGLSKCVPLQIGKPSQILNVSEYFIGDEAEKCSEEHPHEDERPQQLRNLKTCESQNASSSVIVDVNDGPASSQSTDSQNNNSSSSTHSVPFQYGSQNSFIRLLNTMPSKRRQALANAFNDQELINESNVTSLTRRQNQNLKRTDNNQDDNTRNKLQKAGAKRVMTSLL